MLNRKVPALVFVVVSIVGGGCKSIAASDKSDDTQSFKYTPSKVSLEGILEKQEKYGPPNFGESPATDTKVRIYVLHLTHSINVMGDLAADANDPDVDSYADVKEVQLEQVFGNGVGGLEGFLGKNIRADGTLHERISPGDYTDVIMDVESVVSLPK